MNLLQLWNHKNIFDHDDDLCRIECKSDAICCVKQDVMIGKSIHTDFVKSSIGGSWELIVLSGEHTLCSKTSHVQLNEQNTKVLGFMAKRKTFEQIQKYLTEKPGNEIKDFINDSTTKTLYYALAIPVLHSSSDLNSIKYYDYYSPTVIWDELVRYCKEFVKNVSVRHQLKGMGRIGKSLDLVSLFDFKLGMAPKYVNELLLMSQVGKLSDADLDLRINQFRTKQTIDDVPKEWFNKDVINLFFDKYVYEEPAMCVIIPSFNNINYYVKNLSSLMNQNYTNWRAVYIDDVSQDGTYDAVKKYIDDNDLWERITLMRQSQHNAQCCGRYMGYYSADDDEIVCNMDGDDWMYDREDSHKYNALLYVSRSYRKGMFSSYGCFYKSSGPQWLETKTLYTPEVVANKQYRTTKFLCKHMRTGYAGLYKNISIDDLMGIDGRFLHMCTDVAVQYAVCEMAGDKHENVLVPTYVYNQDNSVVYNNSWYNLEKKDNTDNKTYYEWITKKIATQTPYATLQSPRTDPYYDFDISKEILTIVVDLKDMSDDEKQQTCRYIESKIDHEIKHRISYKLVTLDESISLKDYIASNDCSDTILYIDTVPENIPANFDPILSIRWMMSTRINHVLLDKSVVDAHLSTSTHLTPDDSPVEVKVEKFPITTLSSGYYTKQTFIGLMTDIKSNGSADTYHLLMNPMNHITFIVALYNIKKEWVKEALDSVKSQTSKKCHVVVCDDRTPDLTYTRDIMNYLYKTKNEMGHRLEIISNSVNRGLAGTNRTLIGSGYTSIIACLDPDDTLTSDCVEKVMEGYATHNECDFIYSNFNYCDEDMNVKSKGYNRVINPKLSILEDNCVSHLRTYKKVSYHKTPGYDPTLKMAEDKDIIYKFEEMGGKFHMLNVCLYNYRYNSTSLTKNTVDPYNDHKSFQYCKDAIKQSYYRRFSHNKCIQYSQSIESIFPRYGMKGFSRTKYEQYFDNYFDMVYCINLQNNTDNFNKMKIKLNIAGIEKVTFFRFKLIREYPGFSDLFQCIKDSGINTPYEKSETEKRIGLVGELGCLESHLYCLKHAKINGYKRILILEDDVYFDKHFMIKFREMTKHLPSDWQFMMLGASQWSWWGNAPHIKNNTYHPTRASLGTFAVGIVDELMTESFNEMSGYDGPSDLGGYQRAFIKRKPNESIHSLAFLQQSRPPIDKCFVIYPNLAIADTRKSEIRNKSSNEEFEKRCEIMDWNLCDKFIADEAYPGYRCNESKYTIINVDDYDAIYPDVSPTLPEPHQLIADKSLPVNVHNIMAESRNNLIHITYTPEQISQHIYYKKRLEGFQNITWIEAN